MSLFDIYKAKQLGAGAGSLFDAKAGGKLNKNAWKKGFNKWDEEWDLNGENCVRSKNHIPCLPNTQYYFQAPFNPSNGHFFYDESKTMIPGTTRYNKGKFTTPEGAYYMKFVMAKAYGDTYNNDICINISGEHDGEYVPYDGE